MATYARRRSSSISFSSPRLRECGNTPSSRPTRKTTGNSSGLAAELLADELVVALAELDDLLGVDLDVAGGTEGHRGRLVGEEARVGQGEAALLGRGQVDHHGGAGAEAVDDRPDGRLEEAER